MDAQDGTQQSQQLILANNEFLLKHQDVPDIEKVRLKDEVLNSVKSNDMTPYYETLVADKVVELDQSLLDSMRAKNEDEIKKLDEKIADAEENLGESEVREAHLAKSLYYIQIGEKEKALEQLKVTESKTVAVGQKMDLYKSFFLAFAGLTEQIKLDRYLHPHFRFYMREIRTVVYSQFLESYKSVTIEAMAKAFGVTVEFIDLELSRFIAAGKLHCKIDKVAGVLETNRPDAKNALYQATIKQGDFLLNRIQKLSRVIDL
ncbi:hypothetical protein COLO4_22963 [Corchorus olitorius]|uniref:PCI domain-containing protein n=1 Tax=Corchorus olitorius TaxID=93759 RepID=A0A1R3IIQ3_9ROSI|nr:hypothetical protein COLO4_22963 [Corchorus olitorius]